MSAEENRQIDQGLSELESYANGLPSNGESSEKQAPETLTLKKIDWRLRAYCKLEGQDIHLSYWADEKTPTFETLNFSSPYAQITARLITGEKTVFYFVNEEQIPAYTKKLSESDNPLKKSLLQLLETPEKRLETELDEGSIVQLGGSVVIESFEGLENMIKYHHEINKEIYAAELAEKKAAEEAAKKED